MLESRSQRKIDPKILPRRKGENKRFISSLRGLKGRSNLMGLLHHPPAGGLPRNDKSNLFPKRSFPILNFLFHVFQAWILFSDEEALAKSCDTRFDLFFPFHILTLQLFKLIDFSHNLLFLP